MTTERTDPVAQAIRDAHARGLAEGTATADHELALRVAGAQLETIEDLLRVARRTAGATPAIYLPPTLIGELEKAAKDVIRALKRVTEEDGPL